LAAQGAHPEHKDRLEYGCDDDDYLAGQKSTAGLVSFIVSQSMSLGE